MRRIRLLPILFALVAAPAWTQAMPDAAPLPDPDLAAMRGGFALPGGVDVSVGIVTDARIDGQLVVRSAYSVADGVPLVQVSARRGDGTIGDVGLQADGASVTTADGSVAVSRLGDGIRIAFRGNGTNIDSLAGQITGQVVQNVANNRSIDIATNVDINLSGASADRLGSLASRVDTLALDATSRLTR